MKGVANIRKKPTGFLVFNAFWQHKLALIILVINVVILFLFGFYLPGAFYPWFFGLFFGFVLQRSRFCFASAFRDIFLIRNTRLTRAVLIGLIVSTIGFLVIETLMPGLSFLETFAKVRPVGLFTGVGAFLFGVGMVVAGGCASGVLMRSGEGYLMQWVALLGFLVGSGVGAWQMGWWYDNFIEASPAIYLPHLLGWSGAVVIQFLLLLGLIFLAYAYEINWKSPFRLKAVFFLEDLGKMFSGIITDSEKSSLYNSLLKKPWPYVIGGVSLGLLNIFFFALWGAPWGVTTGMTYFAAWASELLGTVPHNWYFFNEKLFLDDWHCICIFPDASVPFFTLPLIYHFMAIIMGSFLAALLAGEFRIRKWRSGRFFYAALIGGVMMGFGARIALGCNIGAFFSAIPSFSLHGWIFGIFVLAGSYVGGKVLLHFLVD